MRVRYVGVAAILLTFLAACAPQSPEPRTETEPLQGSVTIKVNGRVGLLASTNFTEGQSCEDVPLDNSTPPNETFVAKDQDGVVVATGEWTSAMSSIAPSKKLGLCTLKANFEVPAETTFVQVLTGDFDQTFSSEEFVEGISVRLQYNE